jgi:hypothetical protein
VVYFCITMREPHVVLLFPHGTRFKVFVRRPCLQKKIGPR